MKNLFYLTFLSFFIISCNDKNELQTIKVNDYSIEIPKHLSKTTQLNDVASLQYQNLFDEFYVLVIDEKKKDIESVFAPNSAQPNNIDGYCELLKINMPLVFKNLDFSKIQTIKINGLIAKTFTLENKIDGIDIFYQFGLFESKSTYYEVMTWTLLEKKKENQVKMQKIIESFKESKSRAKTKI